MASSLFYFLPCHSCNEKRFQIHVTRHSDERIENEEPFVRFHVIPEYYIWLNKSNIIYIMS
jgi:hypothetical protein